MTRKQLYIIPIMGMIYGYMIWISSVLQGLNDVHEEGKHPNVSETYSAHNKLQRSHSERIKERARAIMKKIDLRSSSRRRKEARHHDPTTMVIGDPVLVSYDSASPETMRMIPRPSNLDGIEVLILAMKSEDYCIQILRFLRQMAPDTVGIFRKNGVKSRILELRTICDRDSDVDVFVEEYRLDQGQVHDVADVLKQYLRELPEPLMTARLSETFANIFIHVPENERLATLQYAILLLPDENREALQTLLLFLYDVSKHADSNNMPAQNLAVCFTPSLFHLSASRLDKVTPTRRHKTIGAAGMPSEQEMRETRAAQQCLTYLIQHLIFMDNIGTTTKIRYESRYSFRSHTSNGAPLLKELGLKGPRSYLIDKVLELVKEHSEQWKAWIFDGVHDDVEISHKIPNDCHPLKLYRAWVDVAAPPKQVMSRIMRERNVWDTSVVNWRTIDVLHAPDTDLHQYVLNDTVGHPTRDCFVARFHRSDLSEIRGACAITERSVQCSEAQLLGGISAEVLDCRFLIEPKAGHSRVTYISRVDLRGRGPTWYNKVYGCIIARQMIRLRDSFQSGSENVGPETKV
uniref:Rho-GAP domain-containing protein n=1 Tax=Angiostrongylus cantonensis TaxID=6313 RepID=A0A158PB52_ANGCA